MHNLFSSPTHPPDMTEILKIASNPSIHLDGRLFNLKNSNLSDNPGNILSKEETID